jgi:hypothetical protein
MLALVGSAVGPWSWPCLLTGQAAPCGAIMQQLSSFVNYYILSFRVALQIGAEQPPSAESARAVWVEAINVLH